MIARLDGRLAEKRPEEVVIDVGGVGYAARIPLSTFLELPEPGARVKLDIHTHVRDDAIQLYGFLTRPERSVFELLIGVSGIGPKLALAILSGMSAGRFAAAVRRSDLVAIRAIPGVGAKTAERILVELRGKLDGLRTEEAERDGAADDVEEAALSALANLGYAPALAERAVRKAAGALEAPLRLEVLIREALRVAAG